MEDVYGIPKGCMESLNSAILNPESEFYRFAEENGYEGWQTHYNILKGMVTYDSATDMYVIPEAQASRFEWGGDLSDLMDLICYYGQDQNPICEEAFGLVTFISSGQHSVGG